MSMSFLRPLSRMVLKDQMGNTRRSSLHIMAGRLPGTDFLAKRRQALSKYSNSDVVVYAAGLNLAQSVCFVCVCGCLVVFGLSKRPAFHGYRKTKVNQPRIEEPPLCDCVHQMNELKKTWGEVADARDDQDTRAACCPVVVAL